MARIAIIGGSVGGLMCARVLQGHGIDVTVYDADAAVDSRDLGGTLDLHADTGQIALQDAGLLDEFMGLARVEDQAKRNVDQHNTVLAEFVPTDDDTAAPEIDRGQLRILLDAHVTPGTVHWGHKLLAITQVQEGVHRLEFANGVAAEVDLVIGADGAWSRVRRLVSDVLPVYSGVAFLDVRYDDADTRHPHIAEIVGAGHLFANNGQGRAIIAQRNSNGCIRGYIAMAAPADWAKRDGIDITDLTALRAYLLQQFQGWSPDLLPFLTESDSYTDRGIWTLPVPTAWPHTPGVTLLGDAAHVMSPFGGFGTNLALLDAGELAHAIAGTSTIDAAITIYEETMQPRGAGSAAIANGALSGFFGLSDASSTSDPDLDADVMTHRAPDHALEHEHYVEQAAAYRLHHSEDDATMSQDTAVDGTWMISYQAGGRTKEVDVVLTTDGEHLTGTFNDAAITDGRIKDGTISFKTRLTTPFPMPMALTGTITGHAISGTAKVPIATLPFTGKRTATVRATP